MARTKKCKSSWQRERHKRYANAGVRLRNKRVRVARNYARCNDPTPHGLRTELEAVAQR